MGIVADPIAGMAATGLVVARHDDGLDWHLLNDFQRDFPLQSRPFARIARVLGCEQARVRERLEHLQSSGAVSRVGPVFAPRRVGASTLAALRVPPRHLPEVAAVVSASAAVNHNYAREHAWNLWFVATAADRLALARSLREIRRATACPMIELPLLTEYHIDLGFDLATGALRWRAELPAPWAAAIGSPQAARDPYASPVIDGDGNVYVTSAEHVNAFDPGGRRRWRLDTGATLRASPAVDDATRVRCISRR